MTKSENIARILSKLFDARDAMRRFYGERYAEKIEQAKTHIRARMKRDGIGDMEAVQSIVKELQEKKPDSAFTQGLFLAAFVEMNDP